MTIEAAPPREALVVRMFQAIDECEWDRLPELFAEDCVYERPGYEPIVGISNLLHFYRHERIIGRGRHDLTHVVQGADVCACWGTFRGFSRTQEPLEEQFADGYELAGGRIRSRKTFFYRPAI